MANASAGRALRWIVGVLQGHDVPFQVVGGVAAVAHGSKRDVVDVDLYVPDDALGPLADAHAAYLQKPPARHRDECWDLVNAAFVFEGCTVELGGTDSASYRSSGDGTWHATDISFRRSERRDVLDVSVPVMPSSELLAYKTRLGREVDLIDCYYLSGATEADLRLAVYGSLAPGETNHEQLAALEGRWESGTVRGELHARGWGATQGYPGLRWHPDADVVGVQLFTSPDLVRAWTRLDRFEGPGYERALVPVTLADGRVSIANIYLVGAP